MSTKCRIGIKNKDKTLNVITNYSPPNNYEVMVREQRRIGHATINWSRAHVSKLRRHDIDRTVSYFVKLCLLIGTIYSYLYTLDSFIIDSTAASAVTYPFWLRKGYALDRHEWNCKRIKPWHTFVHAMVEIFICRPLRNACDRSALPMARILAWNVWASIELCKSRTNLAIVAYVNMPLIPLNVLQIIHCHNFKSKVIVTSKTS